MPTETILLLPPSERQRLLGRAHALALITIFYNILEGLVSVGFGLEDETVAYDYDSGFPNFKDENGREVLKYQAVKE